MAYPHTRLLSSHTFHADGLLAVYCEAVSLLVSAHPALAVVVSDAMARVQDREQDAEVWRMPTMALCHHALERAPGPSLRLY